MHRWLLIALVLTELNFRCVRDELACDDDDSEQACSEAETETGGETEGAPVDLPPE